MTPNVTKVDGKTDLRELYGARRQPTLVDVPELTYLMIDGAGDPNTVAAYRDGVKALYSVSYAIKYAVKDAPGGYDYRTHSLRTSPFDDIERKECARTVMPLEGLWWSDDPTAFRERRMDAWRWRLMILQPPEASQGLVDGALARCAGKAPTEALDGLRLERQHEGPSAQIMHIGPHDQEAPTIDLLHAFIDQRSLAKRGRHHEIYLSNPQRSAPEKMKTVIRQPVEEAH